MAIRKRTDQLLVRVLVGFTPAQLEYIDDQSACGRGAYLRWLVAEDMKRHQLQSEAYSKRLQTDPMEELDYATPSDFEITFNAYAAALKNELLGSFQDGQNVRYLVPAFSRFLKEFLQKRASEEQIHVFLREKMFEVGNTNESEST